MASGVRLFHRVPSHLNWLPLLILSPAAWEEDNAEMTVVMQPRDRELPLYVDGHRASISYRLGIEANYGAEKTTQLQHSAP